jgi:hypothetical protein
MTTETQPTLKDVATRTAVLTTLADFINAELKASKAELQQRLKAAKEDTGTQQIGLSLPDGQDVGKATLVQPKAAAVIVDEKAFLAWVRQVRPSEIVSRVVTEVRPAWAALVLKEITAAGAVKWCDKDTGELHDVPGVQMQGRAAYTLMTVPDEGRDAIAAAWRNGQLAALGLPQLTAGGEQ